ncbi:phosphoglycolate phosphatase [Poseidonocella sp. HB161398]|uniref:phosphoglycolate phosphatase n=1 Tax=Poseidonocella sp. HB161398 TaxID=2320855 RepID=UPI0011098F30|nr:phosphoglycolate phosphatase [Poseidonocella sp. HB161398]
MTPIVFDLDGTLIDSAPDIHAAAAKMQAEAGLAPLGLARIRSFIGNGVPVLVERIMAAQDLPSDPELHDALTARFLAHYDAAPAALTRPYPHVPAMLAELAAAGHPLGLCTNKPVGPSRAILAALGLGEVFAAVTGGDSLPLRKPDPMPLCATFAALGGKGIYVGDSEVDAATAGAAQVPFLLFTEGYRKTPVDELRHDAAFADFSALPGLVRALRKAA